MRSLLVLCLLMVFEQIRCQNIFFPSDSDESYNQSRFYPTRENSIRKTSYRPSNNLGQIGTTEKPNPIVDQEKCPGNQLLYPGDPWFCDCGPRFIFYEAKNECYSAYTRGPCPKGQHLIVENRRVICVRNPCQENYVRYNGRCYELENSEGPCDKINGTTAFLKVNPDTLAVECTKSTAGVLTLFNFPDRCPPGSKRDSKNKCRENWNV